jgi:hypothetical protein
MSWRETGFDSKRVLRIQFSKQSMVEQGNLSVVMVRVSLDSPSSEIRHTLVFSKSGSLRALCVQFFDQLQLSVPDCYTIHQLKDETDISKPLSFSQTLNEESLRNPAVFVVRRDLPSPRDSQMITVFRDKLNGPDFVTLSLPPATTILQLRQQVLDLRPWGRPDDFGLIPLDETSPAAMKRTLAEVGRPIFVLKPIAAAQKRRTLTVYLGEVGGRCHRFTVPATATVEFVRETAVAALGCGPAALYNLCPVCGGSGQPPVRIKAQLTDARTSGCDAFLLISLAEKRPKTRPVPQVPPIDEEIDVTVYVNEIGADAVHLVFPSSATMDDVCTRAVESLGIGATAPYNICPTSSDGQILAPVKRKLTLSDAKLEKCKEFVLLSLKEKKQKALAKSLGVPQNVVVIVSLDGAMSTTFSVHKAVSLAEVARAFFDAVELPPLNQFTIRQVGQTLSDPLDIRRTLVDASLRNPAIFLISAPVEVTVSFGESQSWKFSVERTERMEKVRNKAVEQFQLTGNCGLSREGCSVDLGLTLETFQGDLTFSLVPESEQRLYCIQGVPIGEELGQRAENLFGAAISFIAKFPVSSEEALWAIEASQPINISMLFHEPEAYIFSALPRDNSIPVTRLYIVDWDDAFGDFLASFGNAEIEFVEFRTCAVNFPSPVAAARFKLIFEQPPYSLSIYRRWEDVPVLIFEDSDEVLEVFPNATRVDGNLVARFLSPLVAWSVLDECLWGELAARQFAVFHFCRKSEVAVVEIGNLVVTLTNRQILDCFREYGPIKSVNKIGKGCSLEFYQKETAEKVAQAISADFPGVTINVT